MKEIYKIYASTFLVGLASAISVINTLYFLSNGLSQSQIGTLAAIFFICMAVFDIPTGAIADTFGHKTSVFIGLLIQSLASLVLALGNNFYFFVVAMVASGVGFAFQSGAYNSLIHDILNRIGKSDEFIKVQGRTISFLLVGSMLASPFMSFIYSRYSRLPFWISFVSLFLAAVILQFVKWEFKGNKPSFGIYFQKLFRGVTLTMKKRDIVALILIVIGMGFTNSLFNQNISQPLLLDLGVNITSIGTVFAVFSGIEAILNAYSHIIYKKIGVYPSLLLMIFISATSSIILSQIDTKFGLILMLLFILANGFVA